MLLLALLLLLLLGLLCLLLRCLHLHLSLLLPRCLLLCLLRLRLLLFLLLLRLLLAAAFLVGGICSGPQASVVYGQVPPQHSQVPSHGSFLCALAAGDVQAGFALAGRQYGPLVPAAGSREATGVRGGSWSWGTVPHDMHALPSNIAGVQAEK